MAQNQVSIAGDTPRKGIRQAQRFVKNTHVHTIAPPDGPGKGYIPVATVRPETILVLPAAVALLWAPWVLLSMSSSPGDHRWSMATATDLRFSIDAARKRLGANLHVATLIVSTAVERHPSSAARERLVALKRFLTEATERDAALLLVANHGDVAWEQFDQVAYDANSVAEVRALFQALQSEFGLGAKAALRRTGIDQEEAALIAKRLSSTTVSDLLPGDLLPALGDLLDRLREEQAHAERAKEQQRAAREEPAAAPAPASIELPEIRAVRHELRLKLEQLRARTATALQDIDRAIAEVSATLEETALPNAEELERLRSENKALRAVIQQHQLKIAD